MHETTLWSSIYIKYCFIAPFPLPAPLPSPMINHHTVIHNQLGRLSLRFGNWLQYSQINLKILYVEAKYFYIILQLCNLGPEYQICFSSVKKTCNAAAETGRKKNQNKFACKKMCNTKTSCNFIFLTDSKWCIMYKTCDEIREPTKFFGTTYSKGSCPGTFFSFIQYIISNNR